MSWDLDADLCFTDTSCECGDGPMGAPIDGDPVVYYTCEPGGPPPPCGLCRWEWNPSTNDWESDPAGCTDDGACDPMDKPDPWVPGDDTTKYTACTNKGCMGSAICFAIQRTVPVDMDGNYDEPPDPPIDLPPCFTVRAKFRSPITSSPGSVTFLWIYNGCGDGNVLAEIMEQIRGTEYSLSSAGCSDAALDQLIASGWTQIFRSGSEAVCT